MRAVRLRAADDLRGDLRRVALGQGAQRQSTLDRQSVAEARTPGPRLQGHSPLAPLVFCADAGLATARPYDWLEDHGLSCAIGFGSNVRLKKFAAPLVARAQRRFERTSQNMRMFSGLRYRGRRWGRRRRILIKVEVSAFGLNVRFVVTNRPNRAGEIFASYNDRGVAERYIDELKNVFAFDRPSCSHYRANALRVNSMRSPMRSCTCSASNSATPRSPPPP